MKCMVGERLETSLSYRCSNRHGDGLDEICSEDYNRNSSLNKYQQLNNTSARSLWLVMNVLFLFICDFFKSILWRAKGIEGSTEL